MGVIRAIHKGVVGSFNQSRSVHWLLLALISCSVSSHSSYFVTYFLMGRWILTVSWGVKCCGATVAPDSLNVWGIYPAILFLLTESRAEKVGCLASWEGGKRL